MTSIICRCGRWLKSYYPVYFFETPDVPKEYLISREQQDDPSATQFDLVINGKKADGVVQQYFLGELKDLVLIPFGAMDAWFEEEEQIFVHPKDPYKVSCVGDSTTGSAHLPRI